MGTGGSEKLEDEGNETFPGLIPLCQEYLRNIEVDADTMCSLSRYFKVMKDSNQLYFRKFQMNILNQNIQLKISFIFFYSSYA